MSSPVRKQARSGPRMTPLARLILGLTITVFLVSPSLSQTKGTAREDSIAPNFELNTLDNKTIRLADYRGKIVVLNFWATWCTPCRRETPLLLQADQEKTLEESSGSRGGLARSRYSSCVQICT